MLLYWSKKVASDGEITNPCPFKIPNAHFYSCSAATQNIFRHRSWRSYTHGKIPSVGVGWGYTTELCWHHYASTVSEQQAYPKHLPVGMTGLGTGCILSASLTSSNLETEGSLSLSHSDDRKLQMIHTPPRAHSPHTKWLEKDWLQSWTLLCKNSSSNRTAGSTALHLWAHTHASARRIWNSIQAVILSLLLWSPWKLPSCCSFLLLLIHLWLSVYPTDFPHRTLGSSICWKLAADECEQPYENLDRVRAPFPTGLPMSNNDLT